MSHIEDEVKLEGIGWIIGFICMVIVPFIIIFFSVLQMRWGD